MKNVNAARACAAIASALALVTLAACDRGGERLGQGNKPDPSADLIGTPPAKPTGDPPGTTPVDSNTTTISKQSEVNTMPHEGDNHSYSSVAVDNPQKPSKTDAQQAPERTQQ